MEKELVSIIVPVYNVQRYVKKCITSLVEQTYRNIEIVIVDDGSQDDSLKLCENFVDDRIKIYSKDNGGLSSARNFGLSKATGDLIMFVDSDDYVEQNYVATMYDLLKKNDADMVICSYSRVDENNVKLESFKNVIKNEVCSKNEMHSKIHQVGGHCYVIAWNKLYRRHVWNDLLYPIGKYREDEYVIHRVIDNCNKIVCTNDELYYYRQNQKSIMETFDSRHLDIIDAYLLRIAFYCENENLGLATSAFSILCGVYARFWAKKFYRSNLLNQKEKIKICYCKLGKNLNMTQKIRYYLSVVFPYIYLLKR